MRALQPSLENIVNVTEAAFKKISHLKNHEQLLVLGNTGCGKSTMITSLVFGTDKLQIVKIPEVKMVRGKEKKFYKNNIDQTEGFKEFLLKEQIKGLFEIGHSTAESMTFIPHFFKPAD